MIHTKELYLDNHVDLSDTKRLINQRNRRIIKEEQKKKKEIEDKN